jgi:chromate transporter
VTSHDAPPRRARDVRELALAFLRLGTTAFGGPVAHIAMMEQEFVRRRAWLSREEFLDLVGAAVLIPGPSSTELAIYLGYRRAGWRGLLVAGFCFILPAALMVTAVAWAYVRYGQLPAVSGMLYGVKPVIIAIVAQALLVFGRTAVRSAWLAAIGIAAAFASALGVSPVLVLFAAGAVCAAARAHPGRRMAAWIGPAPLGASAVLAAPAGLLKLFLVFLKVGALVFGSGYVLLAFLRGDLVEGTHWLTEPQLIDAVAVGQFTPGPVFTTATFIGYIVAGVPGALVATIGIFLPSFLLVAVSGPLIPRVRRSRIAGAFLDGVSVAAVALMGVAGVQLGRAAIVDVPTALIAAASAGGLCRWRVNSAWFVLGGGLLGALFHGLR